MRGWVLGGTAVVAVGAAVVVGLLYRNGSHDCTMRGGPEEQLVVGVAVGDAVDRHDVASVRVCLDEGCHEVGALGLRNLTEDRLVDSAGSPDLRALVDRGVVVTTTPEANGTPTVVRATITSTDGTVVFDGATTEPLGPTDIWVNGEGCEPRSSQILLSPDTATGALVAEPPSQIPIFDAGVG